MAIERNIEKFSREILYQQKVGGHIATDPPTDRTERND
jgi:hypothetical protein